MKQKNRILNWIYLDFGGFLLVFLLLLHLIVGSMPFFSCFTIILATSSFGVINGDVSWEEKTTNKIHFDYKIRI